MVLYAVLELTISLVITSIVLILLCEVQHLIVEFLVLIFFLFLIKNAILGWVTLARILLSPHNVGMRQQLLESPVILAVGNLGLLLLCRLSSVETLQTKERLILFSVALLLYVITTTTGSLKNVAIHISRQR